MKASLTDDSAHLDLGFDSSTAAEEFGRAVLRESGFLVQLGSRLALHHAVTVHVEAEGYRREFSVTVAQVFDKGFGNFSTAFVVTDIEATRQALEPASEPADAPEEESPSEAEGEMQGTSPMHRIKAMNPRQRIILANKADRTERQILLRDTNAQVLQNLLNNPRIDSEEVLRIARSSHVNAAILQRIAGEPRWNGNQEIVAAIARHPKTPSVLATRLVPQLRTSDLRVMSKMSTGPKEMIRKAALREYMRRTGQKI